MGLVVRRPVHHHRVRTPAARQGRAGARLAGPAPNGLGCRVPLGGEPVMNAQLQIFLIAAGGTAAVGLAGMGVVRLLRRASLRLSIQVSGAVPVLAIVAGTLGSAEAMFLSQHDLGVVVMVCIVGGIVAFVFSWLLGRQVESGSTALRQAARSLGDEVGQFQPPVRPLAAEFAALSRELADNPVHSGSARWPGAGGSAGSRRPWPPW